MKKRLFLTLSILVLIISIINAYSQDTVILATGEWAPYTSKELDGYGFCSEIIQAAFKEVNIEAYFKFYPWKRCEIQLKMKKVSAIFPYAKTAERNKSYSYSKPVVVSVSKFFYNVLKHQSIKKYNKLNDLKDYKIAGVLGYYYKEMFEKAKLKIFYTHSEEHAFKNLYNMQVDLVPINELVGWQIIQTKYPHNTKFFKTIEKPFNVDRLHLLFLKNNKKSDIIIKKFNKGLLIIKRKRIYQKILNKYKIIN